MGSSPTGRAKFFRAKLPSSRARTLQSKEIPAHPRHVQDASDSPHLPDRHDTLVDQASADAFAADLVSVLHGAVAFDDAAVVLLRRNHPPELVYGEHPEDELLEEWVRKDPIQRLEKHLRGRNLLDDDDVRRAAEEAHAAVSAAVAAAEAAEAPAVETIYSDVYAEVPASLRKQGQDYFDLMSRYGDAAAGDGEFPL